MVVVPPHAYSNNKKRPFNVFNSIFDLLQQTSDLIKVTAKIGCKIRTKNDFILQFLERDYYLTSGKCMPLKDKPRRPVSKNSMDILHYTSYSMIIIKPKVLHHNGVWDLSIASKRVH